MKVLQSFLLVSVLLPAQAFSSACTYGSNGTDLNTIICADGISVRGQDGKFSKVGANNPFGGAFGFDDHTFASLNPFQPGTFQPGRQPGSLPFPLGPDLSTIRPGQPTGARGIPAYNGPGQNSAGGNPGRGYDMYGPNGQKKLSSCQHTLFERKGDSCFSLSASHCFGSVLTDLALQMADNKCEGNVPETNGDIVSLNFKMNSAGSGLVDAKAHINRRYFSGDTTDLAVIEWKCAQAPQMPVVPLCRTPIRDGDRVRYGKIMGQAGLYSGQVQLRTDFITETGHQAFRTANAGTLEVKQYGPKTQNGDSGGPLIKEAENCLVAALSGEAFHKEGSISLYGVGTAGAQSTNAAAFASRVTNGSKQADLDSMLAAK